MKKLNWIPIKGKDGTYCSSACGAGCTYKEFLQVTKFAESVKRMMNVSDEWNILIHENFGWFWGLRHRRGHLSVSGFQPHYDGKLMGTTPKFTAALSKDKDGIGCWTPWHDYAQFIDPNEAVKHRIQFAWNNTGIDTLQKFAYLK